MQVSLNNTTYWIEEFQEGYSWHSSRDEDAEGTDGFFTTEVEVYQDALDWESARRDREAEGNDDRYEREQWHNRNGDVL